jgi:hypothetical protein
MVLVERCLAALVPNPQVDCIGGCPKCLSSKGQLGIDVFQQQRKLLREVAVLLLRM